MIPREIRNVADVVPESDHILHDLDDDCACGPRTDPVGRDDGSVGWVRVHHSLDGREALEAIADAVEMLAQVMHTDRCPDEECDGSDMGSYEHDARRLIDGAREQGWDVVRRAES